jgi:hypothetical protein
MAPSPKKWNHHAGTSMRPIRPTSTGPSLFGGIVRTSRRCQRGTATTFSPAFGCIFKASFRPVTASPGPSDRVPTCQEQSARFPNLVGYFNLQHMWHENISLKLAEWSARVGEGFTSFSKPLVQGFIGFSRTTRNPTRKFSSSRHVTLRIA